MAVSYAHLCPVGIATQNPELRKRFRGKPEYVVNFMRFIAQNLREYMAKLGVHTIDELVGRTDLLRVKEHPKSRQDVYKRQAVDTAMSSVSVRLFVSG